MTPTITLHITWITHWSKFHVMWPLMRKSAVEVGVGLATKSVSLFGAS